MVLCWIVEDERAAGEEGGFAVKREGFCVWERIDDLTRKGRRYDMIKGERRVS